MSPIDHFAEVFRKYNDFEGRSRRAEFWNFYLIHFIAVISLATSVIFMKSLGIMLLFLYAIVSFVPGLAAVVRRLHDSNRSGWWYLVSLIPFGGIILIIFLVQEGTYGPNDYGEDPKQLEEEYY